MLRQRVLTRHQWLSTTNATGPSKRSSMLVTGKHMGDLSEVELDAITLEMIELLYNGLKAE
ncbi:MAG: hypothetical protein LJE85_12895 [Gammaproteobacteria bacterium]|jgi:hypothetical protein|nr:hypothetical protein [Gammaproteobacteria bacterium]